MSTPETEADLQTTDAPLEDEKQEIKLEIDVQSPSSCQRHVTVTIPREEIDRYHDEAISELMPEANVPGFRPGRAPRKLVASRFQDQLEDKVKGALLMDSMEQITESAQFSAISEPDFDYEAIEVPKEGPMRFEFDIEVRPEFDMPEWKGLKLERPTHEITDEEVTERIEQVLSRYGSLQEHDGPAEAGDQLLLDMEFQLDGEIVDGASEEEVPLRSVLSFRDARIDGFDKLMTGAKPGDARECKVTVSEESANEALRGKELTARFDVLEIKRREIPKLTEAFLDRIGGFGSEDELRKVVREELERQLKYRQQQRVREQITTQLTQSADWDLPPQLLRRQGSRELQRAVMELRSSGFSDDEIRAYENQLRQNSLASTAKALKEHFILERIAEEENIDVDPADYDHEIEQMALQSGESPRRIRARLEKQGQMDALRNQIVENKVIELIAGHADVVEKPLEVKKEDTAAVDIAIAGDDEEHIPEAKHGEQESLPSPTDHT